jgi:PASTA domain
MRTRLAALAPRLFVLALVAIVLASATITFAAVQSKPVAPVASPPRSKPLKPVRVPDVTGEAYVFAKGILEEAGFAWRVSGAQGFAANLVSAQSPAAGTLVLDNGAPTIALTLSRNSSYRELGTPENASPYVGTRIVLPARRAVAPAKPKPRTAAPTTPVAPSAPAAPSAPSAPAKPKRKALPKAKPAKQTRPPAFVAPGAPVEPLDEMPLPDRARMLDTWLSKHQEKTDANVKHWSYQHAWVVYGAKFGWWRGAEALEILIEVDRRVQSLWGIGAESEAVAREALAEVRQRSQ